jgi:hypothetical protein
MLKMRIKIIFETYSGKQQVIILHQSTVKIHLVTDILKRQKKFAISVKQPKHPLLWSCQIISI